LPARDLSSGATTANLYEAPEQLAMPTVYHELQKPAASSAPVINATGNTNTTTLVHNALGVQQPPVTSSNVAETGDDVIDNDLYEREG